MNVRCASFPTPYESGTCDAIYPKNEGSHPQIAIMSFAHCLDILESSEHIPLELTFHFLLFPHESLNVLQHNNNILRFKKTMLLLQCRVTRIEQALLTWTKRKVSKGKLSMIIFFCFSPEPIQSNSQSHHQNSRKCLAALQLLSWIKSVQEKEFVTRAVKYFILPD